MTWQRKHQRRIDRADSKLRRRITQATDDLTISDAERHRRLEKAGRKRAKVGAKQIKSAGRRVNQDGTGCAVTAIAVGVSIVGTVAVLKGWA